MEKNEIQDIAKRCVDLMRSSESYETGVQKICEEYQIPYNEILIPEKDRQMPDVSKMDTDTLCESLAFANNKAAFAALFADLQNGIQAINSNLYRENIAASTGRISQNLQLHGYLFEQYHAAVFNMRARLSRKPYVARVLKPLPGERYAKNSVDIVIRNTKLGRDVQKYQTKCGQTAKRTIQYIREGNYNNQRLLVADGQVPEVREKFPNKTVTSFLEYDGITSNSIPYEKVKKLQNAIQSGNWGTLDWGEFSTKDIFYAGLQSLKTPILIDAVLRLVLGTGEKMYGGSDESWAEVLKKTGIGVLDDTSKLGLCTAAQVYIKKELKNTVLEQFSGAELYAVVSLVVDTIQEIVKVADNKQTMDEAIENVAKKVIVTAARMAGASGGALLGNVLGGPIGSKIGSVLGTCGLGWAADKAYDLLHKYFADVAVREKKCESKKTNQMVQSRRRNLAMNS